jgi:TonB dependent receptor/CarboxypepD_reg-like domain/TonB-dependent Receptor Plug Domain
MNGTYEGQSIVEILNRVEKEHSLKVFYLVEWFDGVEAAKEVNGVLLRDFLNQALKGRDVSFSLMHGYALYFYKDPSRSIQINYLLDSARKADKPISKITLGSPSKIAQSAVIKGVVINTKSNEPLVGAIVKAIDVNIGTVTDALGEFELTLRGGNHVLEISSIGFESKVINLLAFDSGSLDVNLEEQAKLLDEVVVSDQAFQNQKSNTGLYKISIADIKKMPAFMGEVDIVRQVQVLPGVTSVGEVSSGFNVRGGSADQNLVLFDGLPVFNYSHVFGFFSAFNADAIKSASFYKGGIPAQFGGRVSSVLDIVGKEADYKKWQGNAGIGLITSSLSAGGPILKDKTSLMVSLRSSYSDWMLKAFAPKYQEVQNSSVSFYDLTAKLAHKIGTKDKLSFSFYASKDNFGLPNDTSFTWQNRLGSLKYDHIFNKRVSFSMMAGMGQYSYQVVDTDLSTAYKMNSSITYPMLNFDLEIQLPKHKLSVGINNILYSMNPGSISPTSPESNVNEVTIQETRSMENSIYVNDGIDLSEKLHIDIGLRASLFTSFGPADVYKYLEDSILTDNTRIDTIRFNNGKTIQQYSGLEPRLSVRYSLTENSSIKLGYNRIYQYIHLISNSVAVTPIDIWQPSNTHIKPQIGDQISLGYYKNLKDNRYELSVEGFYKSVDNLPDFKDGASLVLNPAIETALVRSLGQSYGAEFTFNKIKDAFVYSLNYTYSRSLRRTVSKFEEETINGGKYFSSNFDQPHVVNANFKYAPSRRFAITGNFTYHTGRATTVPVSYNVIDNIPIVNYSERNGYRVPDYHRLDLAFVLEGDHKKKKLWRGTWTMSFYNIYARRNVYTVFYGPNAEGIQSAYRMAIIGTVIPSLSYRIAF